MDFFSFSDTPFSINLNFSHLIKKFERVAADAGHSGHGEALAILEEISKYPELKNGISSPGLLEQNEPLIQKIFAGYFPEELTLNEIKAVSIPYSKVIVNHSQRFKNILKEAGPGFEISISDFDEDQFYIISCCLILNEYYGTNFNFWKPLFYDIPLSNGVTKHYRILYNTDFLEIIATEKSRTLSKEDLDLLINNYGNIGLWKEKFPTESWIFKGFAIMTLVDATTENAVSLLRENLLEMKTEGYLQKREAIFRSIFQIDDIQIGFSMADINEHILSAELFGSQMNSFILTDQEPVSVKKVLTPKAYQKLMANQYVAIANTTDPGFEYLQYYSSNHLVEQSIHSCIFAPILKNGRLFCILEIVSSKRLALNSINANKLDLIMPSFISIVETLDADFQNSIQASIQNHYTSIHKSVYWKFHQQGQSNVLHQLKEEPFSPPEIIFEDVYALYGQIDIKGSSETRNRAIQEDLTLQLECLQSIFKQISLTGKTMPFAAAADAIKNYLDELALHFKAGTEQYIKSFLEQQVHPKLKNITHPELLPLIEGYFKKDQKATGAFHFHRRTFQDTISLINEKLVELLDQSQHRAQQSFPHYYERFKTDGVEHNLYIGPSIAPNQPFTQDVLYQLRIWQLATLCQMEMEHFRLKSTLVFPLEVTTLVLVYHSTIDIRFRLDEKKFDIDGSYNASYEIVKKRIDKACIKGTSQRIAQPGQLAIVYSTLTEEQEYRKYIHILQSAGILEDNIAQHEVEDLQGLAGLKVLSVAIHH